MGPGMIFILKPLSRQTGGTSISYGGSSTRSVALNAVGQR